MYTHVIDELIEYGKLAGMKGYTPSISGNISARIGEVVVITASGTANGYLSKDDFCLIDMEGTLLEGSKKPSTERFLHLKFYKERKDITSVFHVHAPYLTAFSSARVPLIDPVSPELIYCFGDIPIADYAIPGSETLVEKTSKYFKDKDVVLMANHGVIIGASSVKQAYLNLELTEEYAKTILFAKLLGGAKILEKDEVEKIYLLRNK